MITLGVDPGVRSPGMAVAVGDRIVACGHLKIPAWVHELEQEGQRWHHVAGEIVAWASRAVPANLVAAPVPWVVAYERPQIYGEDSKVDPNDLPGLAAIGAAVAARVGAFREVRVVTPRPREWTMGTQKSKKGSAWKSSRGYQLRKRLSDEELAVVPDQHDAQDGACLTLFALGRWTPTRVYYRPTTT